MSYSVNDKYHRYLQDARTRLSIPMSKFEHLMFLFRNMCYQFFVWTDALPFSGALFLPTRSSFFSSTLSSLSHSASLQSYAHDDISVGSWMMGLNATYVDDDRLCCSSSRQGTSFSSIKTMHQLLAVPRKLPCFFYLGVLMPCFLTIIPRESMF